jgi:hypothetical protein
MSVLMLAKDNSVQVRQCPPEGVLLIELQPKNRWTNVPTAAYVARIVDVSRNFTAINICSIMGRVLVEEFSGSSEVAFDRTAKVATYDALLGLALKYFRSAGLCLCSENGDPIPFGVWISFKDDEVEKMHTAFFEGSIADIEDAEMRFYENVECNFGMLNRLHVHASCELVLNPDA